MLKKYLSVLTAAAMSAVLMPVLSYPVEAAAGEYTQNGVTLIYEVSGSEAQITGCSGTGTSVIIPETLENAYTVTSVADSAFKGNTALVSVTVSDSITEIGAYAFYGCSALETVYIGEEVAFVGDYAFSSCPDLEHFSVSTQNNTYSSVEGMLVSKDSASLFAYAGDSSATIPEGVTSIEKAAFFGNTSLTDVSLPSGLASIGDYAFAGCLGLKSITIPVSVTSLGKGCFMNCSSMTQAVLGGGLTLIPEQCFSMCSTLQSVNIPSGVAVIGAESFYSCPQLSGLYVPSTVTEIGTDAIGTHYDIRTGANAPISGFYINGETGSAAEAYAKSCNVDFIDYSYIPLGDIDGNGAVTPSDAAAVLSEYAAAAVGNPPTFTEYQRNAADCNTDGKITPSDAALILEMYVNNATSQ